MSILGGIVIGAVSATWVSVTTSLTLYNDAREPYSAIGAAIAYHGIQNLFLGISGVIIIVVSTLSAVVLNLGLKNGRRNVGKILNIFSVTSEADSICP